MLKGRSAGRWRSRCLLQWRYPFCSLRNTASLRRWIIPAIEALFLVALIVADPGRIDRRSTFVRTLSLGLVVILVAGAAGATVRLVIDLVRGGTETNSPSGLLRIGGVVWVYVIITFTFLYWELDGGGPEARARSTPEFPDLAFPQHLNPRVARPGWRPEFFDYLYLGFTNSTAFSPTDVMPLARWAKLAMAIQATASLVILGLVIAAGSQYLSVAESRLRSAMGPMSPSFRRSSYQCQAPFGAPESRQRTQQ